ncbi:MAG: hypothetical protein ACE5KK_05310 [Candidatus Brocadiales bacterium]
MTSAKQCKMVLTTILSAFLLSALLNAGPALAGPSGSPFNLLPEDDKVRVVKILQDVSKKKGMPTREMHREFWIIWEKLKRWPEADIQDLRDYLVGPSLIYMRYVWEDALDSLQAGAPQHSTDRAKYEKRLLALGIIANEEIQKNEDMISRIAYKEPLTTADGREYVVTEAGIELVLTSLMDASKRIDRLFSKEFVE